jgi:hypothetical protein
MRNKPIPMKLSREEEDFLRQWMYDETHYLEGLGPAKRLQVEHGVRPADLAALIAAAMPDPATQRTASSCAISTSMPIWPWSQDGFVARLVEAKKTLAARQTAEQDHANT